MRFNDISSEPLELPTIEVGDEILVGKFKNRRAVVQGFAKDEHGQPVLKTTKGDQKLFKPRLVKLMPKTESRSHQGETLTELSRPKDRKEAGLRLLASGYEPVGQGDFASLWRKADAPYVLKLFEADDTAYLAFLDLVRQHPNRHFPKLFGKTIKVTDSFYAVRMEPLKRYVYDPSLIELYLKARDFKTDDPNSYTKSRLIDADEFLYDQPELREALDLIIDNLLPKFRVDIKQANLMVRGATIVLTDPVANA